MLETCEGLKTNVHFSESSFGFQLQSWDLVLSYNGVGS